MLLVCLINNKPSDGAQLTFLSAAHTHVAAAAAGNDDVVTTNISKMRVLSSDLEISTVAVLGLTV